MRHGISLLVALLVLAPLASASAGVGVKTDLKARDFAGDPILEDCFDDMARLSMPTNRAPTAAERAATIKIKDALNALSFIGPFKYVLGPRGDQNHPEYSLYDFALWEAVRAFKTQCNLGSTQYGDVGPGTMKKLDELFTGRAPPCGTQFPTPPVLPPPPPPPLNDQSILDRYDRALPLVTTPGSKRRMQCVIAQLRNPKTADGYPNWEGIRRTLPPPKTWPSLSASFLLGVISGNMRHVMTELRSFAAGARTEAELAAALVQEDNEIGRNIDNLQNLLVQDSATDAFALAVNGTIGRWSKPGSGHVLQCYGGYSRRNHDK